MKKLSLLILAFAFAFTAQAQLHGYKWRFGASTGTTNYFGDIRPLELNNFQNFTKYYKRYTTYSDQLSYQLSIEYALGNSVGLMLTGGSYQFGSSDRFIKNDGTLLTDSPTFDRALNFQTDVYDAGLSFVIKPDNNWLLSGKSFFAPYFTVGAGVLSYKVHGDLLDANGNRYDYTNMNLIPDGNFETNLTTLGTERSDNYKTTAFYANLGLGVRLRITKSIEIFAQSDFKLTNTDYLDDVSGVYRTSYNNDFQRYAAKPGTNIVTAENPYRGMENGRPDWYIYHGMGIKFSLGANKTSFNPPVITQRYTFVPTELSKAQMVKKDSLEKNTASNSPVTNNYFTVIQLPANAVPSVKSKKQPALDSAAMGLVNYKLDSLETSQSLLNQEIDNAEMLVADIDKTMALALQDSTVSADSTQVRIQNLEGEKSISQGKITTLNGKVFENQFKIDSLTYVKSDSIASIPSAVEPVSMMNELIIYPGQVSRIIYSTGPAILSLDSSIQTYAASRTAAAPSVDEANPETLTKERFDDEMAKFRKDLLSAQATRDSEIMRALATKNSIYEYPEQQYSYPQQIIEYSDIEDRKVSKRFERNRRRQEKLQEKNNELLKGALLVGATAATTAAITNSGDNKKTTVVGPTDSTLRARIVMDSLIIDSLSNIPRRVDTVTVTEVVEKNIETLLNQSKVEVYFPINESTLSDQEREKLDPVSEFLKNNPEVIVELVGFADNTGSVAYNLALTAKRVEAVTKALTDFYKIEPGRISVSNGGLIVRGRSKGSVETDRKVEIRVLKK